MINNYPGIFNDAIGPVMRGPSSSHTAGSYRIGRVIRDLANGAISQVVFKFHRSGSLAGTYATQGSDIGLAAGILGIEITDPRMPDSLAMVRDQGIDLRFVITDDQAEHPNTYDCEVKTISNLHFNLVALSTGGGLIEVIAFNGKTFRRAMDFPMKLIEGKKSNLKILTDQVKDAYQYEISGDDVDALLIIQPNTANTADLPHFNQSGVRSWPWANSVYPVPGYFGGHLPFKGAQDIEANEDLNERNLWELAVEYERARSGISEETIFSKMDELVNIFRQAIETGLSGTQYADRILGSQSPAFDAARRSGQLLPAGPMERITAYTMAIMESKSAMEVIVAAPTAGAAGGLPGALVGMAEELESSQDELIKAFLSAGLIGVFISQEATFAAEVAGCQAETGAGAGMAAAGLIELAHGTAKQAMGAASIALQNIMGLVCDPVGNRVEVPCLSRNVQAGANALSAANMILGGVDPIIPLSETIQTMMKVGSVMPRELRCTALGGLADTPTARRIENKLNQNNHADH